MNIEEEIATLKNLFLETQKIISKTSETIQSMYEVISDLRERIRIVEEKK